jgi:hypothetical protein
VSNSFGVVGAYLSAGPQQDAIAELSTAFAAKFGYPPPQFAQDGYSAVLLFTYTYSATDYSGLNLLLSPPTRSYCLRPDSHRAASSIERVLSPQYSPLLVLPVVLHLLWTERVRVSFIRVTSTTKDPRRSDRPITRAGEGTWCARGFSWRSR